MTNEQSLDLIKKMIPKIGLNNVKNALASIAELAGATTKEAGYKAFFDVCRDFDNVRKSYAKPSKSYLIKDKTDLVECAVVLFETDALANYVIAGQNT